jgi:hypothetical protein
LTKKLPQKRDNKIEIRACDLIPEQRGRPGLSTGESFVVKIYHGVEPAQATTSNATRNRIVKSLSGGMEPSLAAPFNAIML